MNRLLPFLLAAASSAAAVPAVAQHGDVSGSKPGQAADPVPLGRDQVRNLQQKLNVTGFSSCHVDGLWGPVTSSALMNFQRRNGLQRSGTLTAETVRALDGVTAAAARQDPSQGAAAQETPGAVIEAPRPRGDADQPSRIALARAPDPSTRGQLGDGHRCCKPCRRRKQSNPARPGNRCRPYTTRRWSELVHVQRGPASHRAPGVRECQQPAYGQ